MQTFELTTWDRLNIVRAVGQLRGDVALMRKAIKIFDAIELTEEEKTEINMRRIGANVIQFDDPTRRWPISIDDEEVVNLLKTTIQNYGGWSADSARAVNGLYAALGLD